ncbi:MAG: hypothetical protein EPN23_09710 [Verrucomicrobia bacterium]|nr:MAG: hypothetical protein EPN23_09710 [Verrucomicrobiota bacterium]
MADITLTCSACGATLTASEFVDGSLPCPQCGMLLEKPLKPEALRPHLAAPVERPALKLIRPAAALLVAQQRTQSVRTWARVGASLELRLAAAWTLFVALLVVLLAWQWWGLRDARFLHLYLNARWGVAALTWLAVLIPAFQDTWLQGLLCLFVPPYTVYFALNRLDYFGLRSLYFAVLVALAAEFYFLPQQTLVGMVQRRCTEWAEAVRARISESSAPPLHIERRNFQALEKTT